MGAHADDQAGQRYNCTQQVSNPSHTVYSAQYAYLTDALLDRAIRFLWASIAGSVLLSALELGVVFHLFLSLHRHFTVLRPRFSDAFRMRLFLG
jgi:hypothetical protein